MCILDLLYPTNLVYLLQTNPERRISVMKKWITGTVLCCALGIACVLPSAYADEPYNHPKRQVLRAAQSGDASLKSLLSQGVNINATDEDGETALMDVADDRNATALQLLIANGANVNLADEDGETALMKAADEGRVQNVILLIQAGADVNAADDEGETALDKALDERNHEVVRILRAAGAR